MVLKKLWIIKENLLDTFFMMFLLGMFYVGPAIGIALTIFLMFSRFSPLILVYFLWIFLDRKAPQKGGRRQVEWLRSANLHQRFRNYFPMKLKKTADLPPTKNYIFGTFPHGFLGIAAHGQFLGKNREFERLYPGIKPICHTLNSNFYIPFSREYTLSIGYRSVSKEAIFNSLITGPGNAAILVIGGSAEVMYSNPGVHKVILKNRKGFIKLALTTGSDLVPVYTFGENELYHQYIFPKDSIIYKIQQAFRSYTGIAIVLMWGRGIFQNFFGILPYKKPLYTILGKPISVEKNENPTNEDIAVLHAIFMQELTNLFDEHKCNYLPNPDSTFLTIL